MFWDLLPVLIPATLTTGGVVLTLRVNRRKNTSDTATQIIGILQRERDAADYRCAHWERRSRVLEDYADDLRRILFRLGEDVPEWPIDKMQKVTS